MYNLNVVKVIVGLGIPEKSIKIIGIMWGI